MGEFRHAEPYLLAHATAKGPIQNFTGGLAQMLAEKGIRVDAVAPEPIWTPLIPSTMPEDAVKSFGKRFPIKRPGPPAESATTFRSSEIRRSPKAAVKRTAVIGRRAL